MRSFTTIFFILIFTIISGCSLTQVKGEVGGVEVEASTKEAKDQSNNEGKFCPPGQAKKNRC